MTNSAARLLVAVVALISIGATATSAGASTEVHTSSVRLIVEADALELNTLSITLVNDLYTVTDPTSILEAFSGCHQVDDHTVTCPRFPDPVNVVWQIYVFLDDMDDSATIGIPFETHVEGGDGDDVLTYTGRDFGDLDGGNGNDVLMSGPGEDWLEGGPGDDTLTDAGGVLGRLFGGDGNDVLRGGAGRDCLKGDGGNDVVDGGSDRDSVSGGPGDDVLRGGEGPDLLTGFGGRDNMAGGPGGDRLAARDGSFDRVSGGRGRDQATLDRRLDRRLGVESVVSRLQGVSTWPRC